MQNIMVEATFTVLAATEGMGSGVLFVHSTLWIRATYCSVSLAVSHSLMWGHSFYPKKIIAFDLFFPIYPSTRGHWQ